MKKLLQLLSYPVSEPRHGGQIRASEIRKYFISAGWDVRSLSICEPAHSAYGEDDIIVGYDVFEKYVPLEIGTDYASSVVCVQNGYYAKIKAVAEKFDPDMIFIEQAWLWPAVKRLKADGALKPDVRTVYSSHNTESKVKAEILEFKGINSEAARAAVEDIKNLEAELCSAADFVVTCTESDAEFFRTQGAVNTLVCPNGVARRSADAKSVEKLEHLLMGRKYALFVGSGHPPNAIGFWEMLGDSLAWLAPEQIIISAGSVCNILPDYLPESGRLFYNVNFDRNKMQWLVSEEYLAALIDRASVILLPITMGGGSNLKTAEAIASGRPVVATPTACRGFDFASGLTDFTIAADRAGFVSAVKHYLNREGDSVSFGKKEQSLRDSVYWEHALKGLKTLMQGLNQG